MVVAVAVDVVVAAADAMVVADVVAVAAGAAVAAVAALALSLAAAVSEAAAYRGASAVFADRRRAVGPKIRPFDGSRRVLADGSSNFLLRPLAPKVLKSLRALA
jgi:hypothetical protein